MAETLQKALVPPEVPAKIGNYRFAARYRSALKEAEVGGDFYDVIELRRGKVAVLIGDVIPLGILPDQTYEEKRRRLDSGDRIVMVTDGITEARAPGPVLFGQEELIEYVKANSDISSDELASGILDAATDHAGGHLQDDAAIIGFSVLPRAGE